MRIFSQPKRQVPKPELVTAHLSKNPMFTPDDQWSAFRSNVLLTTLLALLVIACGWLMYGPLFRITTVTVSGTRVIDSKSISRLADQYLNGRQFLILPNRTLWTLSATGLTKRLEQMIRQRISVERVVVIKLPPRSLHIVITERTPVVTWSSAGLLATVDRQGKVIELRTEPLEHVPLVADANDMPVTIDVSVVKPEVMTALVQLNQLLLRANISFETMIIPITTCPTAPVPENTNSNTNQSMTQTNSSNINFSVNRESISPPLICDRLALRFSSQEIHVQLTTGPRVLFDRQSNLGQSVQALQRVLAERTEKPYSTIDVRFGDRVYLK